jgi:hypothetical protein
MQLSLNLFMRKQGFILEGLRNRGAEFLAPNGLCETAKNKVINGRTNSPWLCTSVPLSLLNESFCGGCSRLGTCQSRRRSRQFPWHP